MVLGWGFGYIGGILDKLEFIFGFIVFVFNEKMEEILQEVGCCIVGQIKQLVLVDKEMYRVCDVIGIVDNFGFIVGIGFFICQI